MIYWEHRWCCSDLSLGAFTCHVVLTLYDAHMYDFTFCLLFVVISAVHPYLMVSAASFSVANYPVRRLVRRVAVHSQLQWRTDIRPELKRLSLLARLRKFSSLDPFVHMGFRDG